jgi:hypothetical protein
MKPFGFTKSEIKKQEAKTGGKQSEREIPARNFMGYER